VSTVHVDKGKGQEKAAFTKATVNVIVINIQRFTEMRKTERERDRQRERENVSRVWKLLHPRFCPLGMNSSIKKIAQSALAQ
jgi:hypothetical protein